MFVCVVNRFYCLNNTTRIFSIFFHLYVCLQYLNNIIKTTLPNGPNVLYKQKPSLVNKKQTKREGKLLFVIPLFPHPLYSHVPSHHHHHHRCLSCYHHFFWNINDFPWKLNDKMLLVGIIFKVTTKHMKQIIFFKKMLSTSHQNMVIFNSKLPIPKLVLMVKH